MTLAKEFEVIQAQHAYESGMRAEINKLRLQLREARGEWLSVKDRWELRRIAKAEADNA